MHDTQMSGRLELRWVPVTDERGRTHMEACWVSVEDRVASRIGTAA